jgi:membrane protease YdiL (CAAX protease family)
MLVYALAPQSGREVGLLGATIVAASLAEEVAYRGVLLAILRFMLGTTALAIAISAAAFAIAHATQGIRSGVLIFAVALIMHWLVWVTGTLVLAMVVHAIYDVISVSLIAREARAFERRSSPEM